jgi:hypothetical protein
VPSSLVATASGTSQVDVVWTALANADHYEVFRSEQNGPFTIAGTISGPAFVDAGRASQTTYLYKVRAVSSTGGPSNFSNVDLATTVLFSDSPIVPCITPVRASNILELRTAVNAVRSAAGVMPFSFADAALAGSPVKAVHVMELRSALNEARTALGVPTATYANVLTAGSSTIHAIDIEELRSGVQ